MELRVSCECRKWVAVVEADTGSAVNCTCGRRVEVPLLEEFRNRSDLISATTLEARIFRLVRAGELPIQGPCACCGSVNDAEIVPAILECETSSIRHREDVSIIWVPGLFTMWTTTPEKPEIIGNDTSVPAPICICKPCQRHLNRSRRFAFIWPLVLAIVLGGLATYLHIAVGIITAAMTVLMGLVFVQHWAIRARQGELKRVLDRVPVYRQMLGSYPYAHVIIPQQFGKAPV